MSEITIKAINEGRVGLGSLTLQGWVRTHRQSKSVAFIELNDGSCVGNLQLVIDPSLSDYHSQSARIGTGAAISVAGELVDSPAKGQRYEFQVKTLHLIGEADAETYPLQKKGHTLEFLREHLHLRARSNTFGAVFRVRSEAAFAVHKFFNERGFHYLTSPIITTSDCEGAGEMFQVTTFDLAAVPKTNGAVNFSEDFFKERAGLTVSGQLEGEIFAQALGKVYTFGPTFRAENSNTTRHLAEFWMVEPEVAFCDLEADMRLARDFIVYLIEHLRDKCASDLEFLWARDWTDKQLVKTLESVTKSQFEVIEYGAAIEILEKSGRKFEFPVKWGSDLQTEHERYLTDEHFKAPLFVINYPKEIKAFYMRLNDDGKTVRAMDLLVPRLGEIIGGSQREERMDCLRLRMQESGLPEETYWWYLDLRRFGSVPHAGFGLGFERFLMYLTGMENIRDVIPFPRFPAHAAIKRHLK